MILYHFTSVLHLPIILESGFIRPTESNQSAEVAHAGPDVVWLTTADAVDPMTHGLSIMKTEVRFTIELPRPIRWRDWRYYPSDPTWVTALEAAAAGGDAAAGAAFADTWYVWPAAVYRRFWRALDTDGQPVDFTDRHGLHRSLSS